MADQTSLQKILFFFTELTNPYLRECVANKGGQLTSVDE